VAWSGFYNGSRNIFFGGKTTGRLYRDKSGVQCDPAFECKCPPSDLILSPEDAEIEAAEKAREEGE
jgi:hypothetical protein